MEDQHVIRPPQRLQAMNSSTMWDCLRRGPGGFDSAAGLRAGFHGVLTTCDAHRANIRMLRHVSHVLEPEAVLLPVLCVQHRTGNVLEQLTRFLGNLGSIFCVSKTMSKGGLLTGLRKHARVVLDQTLTRLGEIPAALLVEWGDARVTAKKLVDLCCNFHEESPQGGSDDKDAFKQLLQFFDGPWTGARDQTVSTET